MNIKKIIHFCETFGINLDSLKFYPVYKREIRMQIPDSDFARIYPQEQDYVSSEELEKARESFHKTWWYLSLENGEPVFDIYHY